MGIRYSLPLNDFITLRGGIGGRRRYWCGRHYYPAGPQSLTGAFIRYCLVYPMIGFLAAPIAGGAWLIRRDGPRKKQTEWPSRRAAAARKRLAAEGRPFGSDQYV